MIDEENIKNIINLIENSSQRIRDIKKSLKEKNNSLIDGEVGPLAVDLDRVLRERDFDNIYVFLEDVKQNISFKMNFLKVQYSKLDENIQKIQDISINLDINTDDINFLSEVTETFFYKFKILQNIVFDINKEIQDFSGKGTEYFLKNLRSDFVDFDEKFEQIVKDLRKNSKITAEIVEKLSKLEKNIDVEKELFDINVAMNAVMSSISVFDKKYQDLGRAFEESGIYNDFSEEIKDLSYNTKSLVKNMDNFNKVIENNLDIKPLIIGLSTDINNILTGLNEVTSQIQNPENEEKQAIQELKDIILAQNNDDLIQKIQELLDPLNKKDDESIKWGIVQLETKLNELLQNIQTILNEKKDLEIPQLEESFSKINEISSKISQNIEKTENLGRFFESEEFKNLNNLYIEVGMLNEKIDNISSIAQSLEDNINNLKENPSASVSDIDNDVIQSSFKEIVSAEIKDNFANSFEIAQNTLKYEISNTLSSINPKLQEIVDKLAQSSEMELMVETINKIFEEKLQNVELLVKSIDMADEFSELKSALHQFNEDKHNFSNELLNSLLNTQNETKSELSQLVFSGNQNLKDDLTQIAINNASALQQELQLVIQKIEETDNSTYLINSVNQLFEEKLKNLELLVKSIDVADEFSELKVTLQKFNDEKETLSHQLIEAFSANQSQINEHLESINSAILDKSEQNKNALLNTITTQKEELSNIIWENQNTITQSFSTSQDSLKTELLQVALDSQNSLKNNIDELINTSLSTKTELLQATLENQSVIQEELENVISKTLSSQNDLLQKIENIQNTSQEKLLEVVTNQNSINQSIEHVLSYQSNSREEMINAVSALQESTRAEILNVFLENQNQLSQSLDNIVQKLTEQDDKTELTEIINNIFENKLQTLEFLIKSFDIADEFSELKEALQKFNEEKELAEHRLIEVLSVNQNHLQEHLNNVNNNFLDKTEQNKNTLLNAIDAQKDALQKLLDEQNAIATIQNDYFQDFATKQDLQKTEFLQVVYDNQNILKNEIEQIQTAIFSNKNEIMSSIENSLVDSQNKLVQLLQNQNGFAQNIEQILNNQNENKNQLLQIIDDIQSSLKEELEIISAKSSNNKNEILNAILDHNNSINSGLSSVSAQNELVLEKIGQLEEFQTSINNELTNKFVENNQSLIGSFDIFKNSINSNINEMQQDMVAFLNNQEIKNAVEYLDNMQNVLQNLVHKIEEPQNIELEFIKEKIKESELALKSCILDIDYQEKLDDLSKGLEDVTQKLIMQIIQVFDNISFEQETQEIKEYVEESYNNMKNVVNGLKINLEKLLEAPKPIYIEDLQKEVHKISQILENMGPAMPEYVKSLADIGQNIQQIADTKNIIVNIESTSNQLKSSLEEVIEKTKSQDDVKNGVDNLNLSINYVNENLNNFLGEYRVFQDKLVNITQNLESMMGNFSKSDNLNTEYKTGVNEAFKDLKGELSLVTSNLQALYNDVAKVSQVTYSILENEKSSNALLSSSLEELQKTIETSELNKIQDRFSTIIFSLNGFMNSFDEKFGNVLADGKETLGLVSQNNEIIQNIQKNTIDLLEQNTTLELVSQNNQIANEIKNNSDFIKNWVENTDLQKVEKTIQNSLVNIQNNLTANFNESNSNLENGIISVNNAIKDLHIETISTKLNDEFLAISKKLDIDFFDLHKKIIDEFSTIQNTINTGSKENAKQIADNLGNIMQKFNDYSSSMKDAIETNLQNLTVQLNNAQIETKEQKESILNTIDYLKAEVLNNLVTSVEKVANRLDDQNFALKNIEDTKILLSQLVNEKDNQKDNERILKEIEKYQNEFENLQKLLDEQKQQLSKESDLKKDISQNVEQILDKVDVQTGLSFKNMEQTKEYLTEMAIGFDNQSSWLVKVITDYQDELEQIIVRFDEQAKILISQEEKINAFEQKIETQEKKLESIDKKLDLILSKLPSSNNNSAQ